MQLVGLASVSLRPEAVPEKHREGLAPSEAPRVFAAGVTLRSDPLGRKKCMAGCSPVHTAHALTSAAQCVTVSLTTVFLQDSGPHAHRPQWAQLRLRPVRGTGPRLEWGGPEGWTAGGALSPRLLRREEEKSCGHQHSVARGRCPRNDLFSL